MNLQMVLVSKPILFCVGRLTFNWMITCPHTLLLILVALHRTTSSWINLFSLAAEHCGRKIFVDAHIFWRMFILIYIMYKRSVGLFVLCQSVVLSSHQDIVADACPSYPPYTLYWYKTNGWISCPVHTLHQEQQAATTDRVLWCWYNWKYT